METKNRKAVLLQPGKLGDIIICSPIANYYSKKGFDVEWFIFPEFKSFFRAIDYVTPVTSKKLLDTSESYLKNSKKRTSPFNTIAHKYFFMTAKKYCNFPDEPEKLLLDISWGFPGQSAKNNNLVKQYSKEGKTWIQLRYDLAQTPIEERWNLKWNRDHDKEAELLQIIKQKCLSKYGSDEYSIVHNYGDFKKSEIQKIENISNCINFEPIPGFEIYDWLTVLENANNIVCIDSSLCNFVEVVPSLNSVEKYYLGTEESHYHSFMDNILKNNWKMVK